MPCRAHKHWLPRFYAFCCFSGIFPTALMRSLRPCRVGDKSPTLLGYGLPSYLRQACRLLPSFPRRRESIALSSAAVDSRLRGNDATSMRGSDAGALDSPDLLLRSYQAEPWLATLCSQNIVFLTVWRSINRTAATAAACALLQTGADP